MSDLSKSVPLTRQEVELIASVYKLLPTQLPGFVGRQQQKDMIQFVARTFAMEMTSVIEAPTGTGKSFGYQIPGIVLALSRDKRIVISTETANLQDQIAGRDLLVLSNILGKLGMEAPSVVVKGRERYVCPLRLEERASQASLLEDDSNHLIITDIANQYENQWDGLRDSLPFRVPQSAWTKVNNNRHICTNDRCPKAKECPHMLVKAQIRNARVIVTNHSYLLSTIAAQSGSEGKKNPVVEFEKNYYAFDEAHHLHNRCIEAFSSKAMIDEEILNEAGRSLAIIGSSLIGVVKTRADGMRGIGAALRINIKNMVGDAGMHRFTLGSVPPVLVELVEEYKGSLDAIITIMDEELTTLKESDSPFAATKLVNSNIGSIIGQLNEMSDALLDFALIDDKPRARWMDVRKDVCTIYAAPFDAAILAKDMLWKSIRGAVLTSATIASLGEFGPTLLGLGLPRDTMTAKLSSPLNYANARIIVPKFIVEANSKGHGAMVTSLLRSTAMNGDHRGGLVYFTSKKKMDAVYASFTQDEKHLILLQGAMAPSAMIDEHKRRIDAGHRSILFGLDSLAEGVDLPGAYCSLVLIDKLPFPSPDDPILAAHSEHLKEKGLHPFPLLMLPRAGRKLAQVVGRLIRTESDWGDVYVLDRRFVDKPYGARLLKSTPFQFVTEI